MFKRVFVEDWAQIIPIISFCIFAVVFVLTSIRAMRLGKREREHMAHLPLENSSQTTSTHKPS